MHYNYFFLDHTQKSPIISKILSSYENIKNNNGSQWFIVTDSSGNIITFASVLVKEEMILMSNFRVHKDWKKLGLEKGLIKRIQMFGKHHNKPVYSFVSHKDPEDIYDYCGIKKKYENGVIKYMISKIP